MKVVIVGGSGLIGRAVSAAVIRDGIDVVVLTRGRPIPPGLPAGVAVERWSTGDIAALTRSLSGADVVIGLAGTSVGTRPWTPSRRRDILESRVRSTRAVVDAIRGLDPAERPKVLLNASGTDGYTGHDETPATESTPFQASFLADVCTAWETEASAADGLGVRVVLLRIGLVIGPGAAVLRLLAAPVRLGLGGRVGSGRQWISWVHIDDVVGAIRAAIIDPSIRGAVNVVSPAPIRQEGFARILARVLRRPSFVRVPAALIRLAMGEMSALLLGSRRIVPAALTSAGFRFRYTDLETALRDALGEPLR